MKAEQDYPYLEDVNWALLELWGERTGLDVLDVGCGRATTSERIQQLGNRVTGIEQSAEAADVARERLDAVVTADLTDVDAARAALGNRRFDAILFADVLEHLPWPSDTLRRYAPLLAPGGVVLVSLPNVALWSVRLRLLLGRFDYEDTGVLDRTHLRFFTRRTMDALLRDAGLRPRLWSHTPGVVRPFVPLVKALTARGDGPPDPRQLLDSPLYRLYLKRVYPVERFVSGLLPGVLAFQMVAECTVEGTS